MAITKETKTLYRTGRGETFAEKEDAMRAERLTQIADVLEKSGLALGRAMLNAVAVGIVDNWDALKAARDVKDEAND